MQIVLPSKMREPAGWRLPIPWKRWTAPIVFLILVQVTATVMVHRGFLLTLVTDLVTLLLMGSCLAIFLANVKAAAAQNKIFWALVAANWATTLLSQGLWIYFELILRKEVPNPFIGDILLFLSHVPFLAALLLQPNLDTPTGAKREQYLDFSLLLVWWLYLYLFFVIPWGYVAFDEAQYGYSFNVLSVLLDAVLLLTIAFLWRHSFRGWRWVLGSFLAAQSLYMLAGYSANQAIIKHLYYPGSWYDVPCELALASMTLVGLVGLAANCSPAGPRKSNPILSFARLGMVAVLSIPAFGVWAALQKNVPPSITYFRELLTLGTVSLMALLVFAKKQRLEAQLTRANQELQEASMTDFLTRVHNRRFFDTIITGEANQVLRSRLSTTPERAVDLLLYMVDLDGFKDVNDRYGHDMGDKVLVEVARRINALIRSSDVLVRWGGDEFLVVSRNCNRAEAASFASRVLAALTLPIEADGNHVGVSVSMGWAAFPWYPEKPSEVALETVLALSDRALYEAKASGKNKGIGVSPSEQGKMLLVTTAGDRVAAYSVQMMSLSGPAPEGKPEAGNVASGEAQTMVC